jgi:hypothetical protein
MVIFRLFTFIFLLGTCTLLAENPYQIISKRNAFELTTDSPAFILPPITSILPPDPVYLTGITRHHSPKAYLALKVSGSATNKFLSLSEGEKQDNITIIKILKKSVLIDNRGTKQHLTFKTHGLPTVILKAPTVKTSSKGSKSSSKDIKKSSPTPSTPRPQIVTVPSRRPKIDPSIIKRGLEYLEKVEDKDKKKYILERLERLQSGQEQMGQKIDSNERQRRYDEYKRSRRDAP